MQRHQVHYCAACGGPQDQDHTTGSCRYCGRGLVPAGHPDPGETVRCQQCQTASAHGCSFCARCGSTLARRPADPSELACPSCCEPLTYLGLAPDRGHPEGLPVHECRRCAGLWLSTASFEALVSLADRNAPNAPQRTPPRQVMTRQQAKVVYRNCPECGHAMHRKNFGEISGVIVDQCRDHGSFLDPGELEGVMDFIAGGGLTLVKKRREAERAKSGVKSERERLADILIAQSGVNPWHYPDQPPSHGDPLLALIAWARRALTSRRSRR